ncbi:hypothetical protein PNOK_0611500 [Pyrrhoderma noxium]|uniref:Uncharacterized protein n=1 Tax=Pyrrhoderma noxium TaxID=2282107 RepID=A0A286UDP0_9AGAM|nr:hypothetical protein PNOK_0611500 [Pyrrhoderma noxium]
MNHEEEYNLGGVIDSSFDYNSLCALLESHTEIPMSFSDPRDSSLYGALGKIPPNSPPPSIPITPEEVDISSPSNMSTPDSRSSCSPPPASTLRFMDFQSKSLGPYYCPFPNCSGKVISNEGGSDGIKEHGRRCSEEKMSGPQTFGGTLLAKLALASQRLPQCSSGQRSVNMAAKEHGV